MPDAAIAADFLQTFDIHSDLTSQVTLDHLCLVDNACDLSDFIICQISDAGIRVDTCLRKDFHGRCSSNAVDIGKTYFHTFVSR